MPIAKAAESDYIAANQHSLGRHVRKAKSTRKPAAKRPAAEPDLEAEDVERGIDDSDADEDADEDADGDGGRVGGSSDNIGDMSIEVNVEDLIAQIESESKSGAAPDGSARRKIEDILESKRMAREIMDLEDFDIDD